MRNAILMQIHSCHSQVARIPVWASLADWRNVDSSVKEFLWLSTEKFRARIDLDYGRFVALLHAGAFSIYLDGLNELPQRGRPGSHLRDEAEENYERQGVDPREESILKLAETSPGFTIN
jgi:hypothetical protein